MKTKSLLKTFLTLLALMTCLFMRPAATMAQESVPYHATVYGGMVPQEWEVTCDAFGIWYNGLEYYAFSNPFIVLPELDAPTNTLTIDVRVLPFQPPYGASFIVGYLTDANDHSTFHMLESFTYLYEMPWDANTERCKRVNLSGAPSNARIVITALYDWIIPEVSVYETPEPFDVPYSIPSNSSFSWGLGQPEGWMANNFLLYYNYFRDGTALLPVFNSATNLLQLDISMKPYDSYAQSVEVGYVTGSNNSFTTLQTFNNTSSWTDYLPRRISFSNAPSGARMAVRCNGNWQFDNVSVYNPSSTTYTLPYTHSFGATLPDGWLLNNYGYTSGTAYLTSGIAVLPQFQNSTSQTLIFDIAASPKDSNAQNIKIGYITNPNDASTFTEIETFNKTSSWTEFQPKRTLTSLPANARLAVQCNGEWNIRDVSVRIDPGTSLWPTQTAPYHLSTFGSNQPDGWIANNYVNDGVFKTGTSLLPNIHSAFTLNSFYIDIDIKPTTSNNNQTFNIGYVTTSSGQTTFHSLETIYSSSDWTDFRIKRIDFDGVPSGARMALSFGGEWKIRDVLVYPTPSATATPYNPTLGENQPVDWLANNYGYSSGNAFLNDGLAVLPQFDAQISTLLFDVSIRPKNTSATNIKFGYVTNPNDPSTFVATHTFINSSWNDYLPKRMQFVSAPTGARLAVLCNGDWNIAGVSVKATSSVQTVFDVPYNLPMAYAYPEGWIANNCSYTSNGFCFNSGTAVLPQFNATLSTLQMDIHLTPGSGAQNIQIGYVTNPNNPSATFVALQTFNNSSTWNHPLKRVSFYGLNDNVRLAIKCNGTWMVSLLTVYIEPTPLDVPYYNSNNDGWIENISYHDYYMYPLYQSGCAILPRFNAPIGALQLQISFHIWDSDTHNLSIGYIINPNDLSTFTALQTHTASSTGSNWVNETISYFGVPTNARMAFVCEGTWAIGVAVTMPSISIPYTQGFEGMDVGSIPNGWYAPDMSVQGTYNSIAPHGGTKQLAGKGYIVLPVVENADYSALTLSLYARPEMTNYGGHIRVGYIPNGGALSQFVEIKNVTWNTNVSDYQQISASLAGIPADARLALYCFGYSSTANLWHLDDISIKPAETIPYTQPFATNNAPDGWSTYVGHYQESTHTANLTPNTNNSWRFGEANGVFDSHAYATLGDASSNECRWLISPPISLGDANGVNLSFGIAMSREAGNQLPLTPGMQENQRILVLVTTNGGATWQLKGGWCGQMCGLPDLNVLNPAGSTFYFPLSDFQGQTIQVAFYAECFDGNDNNNRVHIDNFSIQSYDLSMPPTSVMVSEVGGHSAKISWTPASSMQYHWDLWLPYYSNPNYINNCTPEYMQENGYYYQHIDGYYQHIVTGLEPNESYQAWVRYNDGTTTSDWVASDVFDTESMCAVPTNLQVEVTQHTALVTWDPGQSNQTSWDTYGGTDDMGGEIVYEPFRLLTGLEPGEEYSINVIGICEDGDGNSVGISTTFTTLSLPTLTVNDGHSQDNDIVPITAYSLPDSESETQFIIPASQLIDMQYSDIRQISFYEGWYRNCAPWGADVWFKVRIMVVPEANYNNAQYPEDQFYGYNDNPDFETLYHGRLTLDNEGKMNISFGDHPFHYENGNLLIGVKQDTDDVGTDYQADWLGVQTQDWSSMYVPAGSDPTTAKFLPKVTFTYEPDDYLPPTNFEAYVTGGYEVTFSWTPREGQTATEIMVCGNPDFVGNQFLTNSTDDHCTVVRPDFFEPEETYYYRYHGVYNVDGENHYSAWSAVGSFTMPDACEPPANVQVTQVTPFSAQLSWNGSGEYEYVEYRELNTQWEEGFEGGALPSGWASIANGTGTAAGQWAVYQSISQTSPHTGSYLIRSVGILNPNVRTDNWLILPQITLGGALKFWACTAMGEQQSFSVYVSTTGTTVADFGTEPIQTCSTTSSYQEFTIDLSGYEGLGYVAIRYQFDGVTGSTSVALAIDDVSYHYGGTWTSAGSTESGQIDLYDLTPGATYQARVRAMCETGYASSWTTPVSFSTPGNIVFEDENVKDICVDNWDTNGDGELSYAEAAAVTTLNPSGVTNSSVFKNNPTITSFNELQYFIGLTEICKYAFAGCASLSAITLPSTITSIGNNAFGFNSQDVGCTSLHSIVIPPSVTTIGAFAFRKSGLTEVDLPYSVTQIGTLAFGDCNNLVSVYLPASVTDINANAFTGAALANIDVDAGNPVYDSRNGCNAIISTANNVLVTGCKNTVVPYGVIAIGSSAFENCSNLTDITLPATVISLAGYAFLNCTSLNTIEVNATTPPTFGGSTFGNLTSGNIKVYVPCGSLETYQDSDWSSFDLVENCNIVFEDNLTKELCVNAWDTNYDGELSYREAAAVTLLNGVFNSSNITRFNELQYFTGLDMIYEDDFTDCVNLTAVTFPPTVTYIDASSFSNCHSLTSLILGENITDIGGYAFSGCEALSFIRVKAQDPPTVGYNAFIDTDGDIPVYVPCGTMGDYEDSDWGGYFSWLIDVCDTIQFADAAVRAICLEHWDSDHDGYLSYGEAAAVTSIGEVFRGNLSIQTFNELWYFTGLTEIGDNAFKGCAWLNTIELPATIASIGSLAFYNTGLVDMSLMPEAIRTIGFSAFGQCRNLTSIVIPASVNYIEGNPFDNCPVLNNIWVYLSNPVYDSRNNCKAIIETATNTLVTGGKNTVIPDDVTALGSYAFSGQTAIASITLPASIASLGNGVFENCTGLTEVNVQAETPPTLGYNVFEGVNTDDVWVYVPCGTQGDYENDDDGWGQFYYIIDPCANIYFEDGNVKTICVANFDTNSDGEISYAEAASVTGLGEIFRGNATITSFDEFQYFTHVTSIEAYAFNGCRALTSITLPPAITSIGNYAFVSCQVLTPFALPSTLTSIGSAAFGNCYALTTIEFPNGLTSIGSSAFMNSGLTSVAIPASVTDIGTNPFRSCSALESITVDPENPKYDSRDGCNAIIYTSTLGSNTRTILISGCKNTVITDGVTIIDPYAFTGTTGLTSITLPGSLTSIGNYTFQNCTGLQSITVLANTPPSLSPNSPFGNVPTDIPVYVPCGTLASYQAATGWSNFTNIIDPCASVTQTIALSAGWNWVSLNIEVENPIAMLQMLEAGMGANGIQIKSGDVYTEYDAEWGWFGDLDELGVVNEQMYKIHVSAPCTITLEGMPINPEGHAITINKGWNWIGFPSAVAMSLDDAFAGFAQDGDIIRNSDGETPYDAEWEMWIGDLETLVPGQGYMYYSASNTPRTLLFPSAK